MQVLGQVRRDAFYGLALHMVDVTLLHISRVYHVVFPRCKVAWQRGVVVCTREETQTAHCAQSPVLATLSSLALEADLSLGLILSRQFPGTPEVLQAALAYQFQHLGVCCRCC